MSALKFDSSIKTENKCPNQNVFFIPTYQRLENSPTPVVHRGHVEIILSGIWYLDGVLSALDRRLQSLGGASASLDSPRPGVPK